MLKTKVSIVKASNYESRNIYQALKKSLYLLGGLEKMIKPGMRVFVKINHLSSSPPEKAVVTNPGFARQLLKILKEHRAEITVGDDIYSEKSDGFIVSGYRQMCEEMDVRLVNLKEIGFKEVDCRGEVLEKVYISPLVLESDLVINLPKLKTHSFTIFTGAVKNMFGAIPHGLRLNYHRLYSQLEVFSQMLVDIFSCAPPQLTIMDAVIAMEGEGPSAGHPRKVGLILASRDSVALDAVASKIIGFNPLDIFTTYYAHQRGLGTGKIKEIEILGEKINTVEVRDFKHSAIALGFLRRKLPAFLYAYLQDQLTLIPEVKSKECTECLDCVRICPTGAAQHVSGSAWIDQLLCIHCMCCHEVCHYRAVKLKMKPIGYVLRKLVSLFQKIYFLFKKK